MSREQQPIQRLLALAVLWLSVGVPLCCILHCALTTSARGGGQSVHFLCDLAPGTPQGHAPAHAPPPIVPETLQALMILLLGAVATLLAPLALRRSAPIAATDRCGLRHPPPLLPPR